MSKTERAPHRGRRARAVQRPDPPAAGGRHRGHARLPQPFTRRYVIYVYMYNNYIFTYTCVCIDMLGKINARACVCVMQC